MFVRNGRRWGWELISWDRGRSTRAKLERDLMQAFLLKGYEVLVLFGLICFSGAGSADSRGLNHLIDVLFGSSKTTSRKLE